MGLDSESCTIDVDPANYNEKASTQLMKRVSISLTAQPVILKDLLRDNETFSSQLVDNLSVPPAVVQSLMRAEINLNPVSVASLLCLSRF